MEDQKLSEKRMAICKTCDQFKPFLNRCGVCGCLMSLKSLFPSEKCPEGKW